MNAGDMGGPIAYMVRNRVAANLLALLIVGAGFFSLNGLVQEAFPSITFDAVEVTAAYPGAAPEEVEEALLLRIEEQVRGLDDVDAVVAVAAEGRASVVVELQNGADVRRAKDEVEAAVGRIESLPAEAERAEVREMTNRQSVIRLLLYGRVPERALKELAYRVEDEIAALPAVAYVETNGVRPYEIAIEPSPLRLQAFGLTVADVASAVRRESLNLSAGAIDTVDAQVRVRTTGQRDSRQDFEELAVVARGDGTVVRLRDVADVRDGFRDDDLIVRYNGQPAVYVEVYRSAGEEVLDVAAAVETYIDGRLLPALPAGVSATVWYSAAEVYEDRLGLLLENGLLGLILVLVTLTLFLEIRVAAWIVVGIAISFVGALIVARLANVSINTTSLFGFVLALGMVVDDAIVVAEHVHAERRGGASGPVAAVRGARRIARPLVFAVLTTVVAFVPWLVVPGSLGSLIQGTAVLVIAVLAVSLLESLFILPRHLSHLPPPGMPGNPAERFFSAIQRRVDRALRWFVHVPLDRALRLSVSRPEVVIAAALGTILLCLALVPAGIVRQSFLPAVNSDIVTAALELPEGARAQRTDAAARELEAAGRRAIEGLAAEAGVDPGSLLVGINRSVGMRPAPYGGFVPESSTAPPANRATVQVKLRTGGATAVDAGDFAARWREEAATVAGAESLAISPELLDMGAPILIELFHPEPALLGPISAAVVEGLRDLQGVYDVESDHATGFPELRIELRPEARTLGLVLEEVAGQVRAAFFGVEAVHVRRGREDVPVNVRLPAGGRDSIADVEDYPINLPGGSVVPLGQVAEVSLDTSSPSIHRKDGRRVVTVSADVDTNVVTGPQAGAFLEESVLPELAATHPGFTYAFGGQQRERREVMAAVGGGFALALLLIYGLLAVPLGSYTRPLIIMAVIPLGFSGALLGHAAMGLTLGMVSLWGMLGVSGVVINDSLMMIDFISRRENEGTAPAAAIVEGAKERFRPIFLTTLTTFLGFAPLLFERSPQARVLVPMAASVGFGLVFATATLMLVVPALVAVRSRESR